MFDVKKKEMFWNGKTLSLETGKIGRQASSVIARMGNAVVMANVTTAEKESEGLDFVPLTITYVEKFYAAGQIPGGFVKREGKPSDGETLIARTIDRPIRPLFPAGYRHETNVFCTLLSYDPEVPTEVLASIAASSALTISKAPFEGPTACVKVGYVNGGYVLNPIHPFANGGMLELTVSGTEDSILMVESEVKGMDEEQMLGALDIGQKSLAEVVKMIKEFASECGEIQKWEVVKDESDEELKRQIKDYIFEDIQNAYKFTKKQDRVEKLFEIDEKIKEKFITEESDEVFKNKVDFFEKELKKEVVRGKILNFGERIDGRKVNEVRPIDVELDILPSVHGSALFTRGETQSLTVLTLGSEDDKQIVDAVGKDEYKERFIMHYNFPPYAVGECGKLGSPGRREIGHGKLAWRGLNYTIPSEQEFPYTIRLVSEMTESNGSSSMATICAGCLALMAGGVPIKEPIAGIAMGLVKDGDKFTVLTDIMGDEDSLGDMDFKVAGTKDKITALQMDIKCKGVNLDIMRQALQQAKEGRLHILSKMTAVIPTPREEISNNAPKMEIIKINKDKIKDVIGSQGKNIKNIVEVSKCSIDIADDGTIKIAGKNMSFVNTAKQMIQDIIFEPEIGGIYEGKVVKILDIGAFVQIAPSVEGFVHISELANYRVNFVDDILREGQTIKVKMIGFDKKGKAKLSYKDVDQKTGEDISNNRR